MVRAPRPPFAVSSDRLTAFGRGNGVVMGVTGLLAWQLGAPWPVALGALSSFLVLVVSAGPLRALLRFGAANGVTALRLVMVLGVAAAPRGASTQVLGAVALVVLGLDALDGWLARRLGTESDFGAVFDMETDALLVLVLGLVAFTRELAGPFVLVGGALRPLYVMCVWLRPVAVGEQRRSWFGRVAFLAVAAGLVSLLFERGPATLWAAGAGTSLVALSFARGFAAWALSPRAVTPREARSRRA